MKAGKETISPIKLAHNYIFHFCSNETLKYPLMTNFFMKKQINSFLL